MSAAGGYREDTAVEAGTSAAGKQETSTVMEWNKPQNQRPQNRS